MHARYRYTSAELSDTSPIKAISAFPQELVLLGRATILIKGIAKRLGIPWSLADKWKAMAEQALECGEDGCLMPTWSAVPTAAQMGQQTRVATPAASSSSAPAGAAASGRPRFREVVGLLGQWAKGKGVSAVQAVPPLRKIAIKIAAAKVEKAN